MRMIVAAASFLLLGIVPAQASPDSLSQETIVSQGNKRTYYLFVPGGITAERPAALVLLLHGSGRNGSSMVNPWKEIASREKLVLAGPDALDRNGWSSPLDGPEFLHDLVEALRAKYPIDPRRMYLFGHSAGAVFAINMALMESEYFAAAAVHAGAFREQYEFRALESAKRKTPISIQIGDKDQMFSAADVKATGDALKAQGFEVEVTIIKRHDHWYYDLAPKINEAAWEFLKKHDLSADPHYERYNYRK
ncbi:MAG TPA: prolyl oligopeptidase family serine peptidase [Blastocatellia bacterium]|nr:prolyl oligopeptidase family serine peptidase [Blastocatellia bacterium]